MEILTRYDHCHRLSTHRSKVIELGGFFVGSNGPLFEREDDVATLHVTAREGYFCDRNIWLSFYDSDLPGINVRGAHSLHQFELPFEPLNVHRVPLRADHREPVAFLDSLVRAAFDVNEIAARKDHFIGRLLTGNQPHFVRDLLVGDKTRAIDARSIRLTG